MHHSRPSLRHCPIFALQGGVLVRALSQPEKAAACIGSGEANHAHAHFLQSRTGQRALTVRFQRALTVRFS